VTASLCPFQTDEDMLAFIDTVYAEQRMPSDWSKEKISVFQRGLKAMTSTVDRSSTIFSFDQAQSLIGRIQEFYIRLKPFSKPVS
jgi:hypothetical protein